MIRRAAPVVAAYAAVTVLMTWPYFSYANIASASYGGDVRLIMWTLAWDNHAVLNRLPLFQSNVFFPAVNSLRYNEHLFSVSLFTLPWAAGGASPMLAYNATWWLTWLLNGVAAYALLRRYVANGVAAFAGSLAFTCNFYVMLHAHGHLHLIWLWPMPLSMLLLERWFDEPRLRRLALWAVVFLMGALASWYMAVMILAVNGLAFVTFAASSRRRSEAAPGRARLWRRRWGHLAVAGALVGACVYPFARHYVGMKGGPGEAEANSATLASYLVPPENTTMGRWWSAHVNGQPGSIYGETTLFAGWTALVLAALGVVVLARGRADRRAWVFPVLAGVGFLVSLGPAPALLPGGSTLAPFAWVAGLPGFEGIRAPARFAAVAMLGVGGLAAMGVAALSRWLGSRRRLAVAALVPLMLAEYFVVGFPAGKPQPRAVPPIYLTGEVRTARALVSLPEYSGTNDWVLGGDYLYYSMWHWRPIVNGFGRTEPPGHADLVARVRDFPHHAAALRQLGLQYVVVHAERYPNHGSGILAAAQASANCRLVRRIDGDYLFELVE